MNNQDSNPRMKFTGLGAAIGMIFGGLVGLLIGKDLIERNNTILKPSLKRPHDSICLLFITVGKFLDSKELSILLL